MSLMCTINGLRLGDVSERRCVWGCIAKVNRVKRIQKKPQ